VRQVGLPLSLFLLLHQPLPAYILLVSDHVNLHSAFSLHAERQGEQEKFWVTVKPCNPKFQLHKKGTFTWDPSVPFFKQHAMLPDSGMLMRCDVYELDTVCYLTLDNTSPWFMSFPKFIF
jgi:hypothetical protein